MGIFLLLFLEGVKCRSYDSRKSPDKTGAPSLNLNLIKSIINPRGRMVRRVCIEEWQTATAGKLFSYMTNWKTHKEGE